MSLRNLDTQGTLDEDQHELISEIINNCPGDTQISFAFAFVTLVIAAQKLMPRGSRVRSRQTLVCLALQAGLRPCK